LSFYFYIGSNLVIDPDPSSIANVIELVIKVYVVEIPGFPKVLFVFELVCEADADPGLARFQDAPHFTHDLGG